MQRAPRGPNGLAARAAVGVIAAIAAIAAVPAAVSVWSATSDPLRTSAELLVTASYCALALLPQPGLRVRAAAAATAVLWVAGAIVPAAATAHQAGLAWLFVAAAGGWRTAWAIAGLAGLAALLASGLLATQWTSVVFAGLSVSSALARRQPTRRAPAVASAVASALVALALFVAAAVQAGTLGLPPRTALLLYSGTLITAAVLIGTTSVLDRRRARRLRAAAAAVGDTTGLLGLEGVLRTTLHDDALRLETAAAAPTGAAVAGLAETEVTDAAGMRVARVRHRPESLAEPAVARAVADAVLLAVEHDRLVQRLEAQGREIARTRADLSDAAQAGRLAVARRVDAEVVAPLREGSHHLDTLRRSLAPPDVTGGTSVTARVDDDTDPLAIAAEEVRRAERDLLDVVDAARARELGDGRLAAELRALSRAGIPAVAVEADSDATGDAATETALYYIASEALSNAMKHADASRIDLRLTRAGDDTLRLEVADDGRGGAESGAAAIRRRVDALAGELSLESPPGRGTRITVAVPRRRSASTVR